MQSFSLLLYLSSAVKVQIQNTTVLVFPRFHPKTGLREALGYQPLIWTVISRNWGEELRRVGQVTRRAFLRVHCWASHHSGPVEVPTYWVPCVGCASELSLEGQRKEMKHCLMHEALMGSHARVAHVSEPPCTEEQRSTQHS